MKRLWCAVNLLLNRLVMWITRRQVERRFGKKAEQHAREVEAWLRENQIPSFEERTKI